MLLSDFVVAVLKIKMIVILIQVMNHFESLAVISVEYYCKGNAAWLKCLKKIDSALKTQIRHLAKPLKKVFKCNQLHNFNKVIEIVTLLGPMF